MELGEGKEFGYPMALGLQCLFSLIPRGCRVRKPLWIRAFVAFPFYPKRDVLWGFFFEPSRLFWQDGRATETLVRMKMHDECPGPLSRDSAL